MRCRFKHKIFQNEENGYTIAIFTTQDTSVPLSARDKYLASRNIIGFSAIGFGLPLTDEIELEMEGRWESGEHGTQYQVENFMEVVPRTKEGILGYLSSGAVKGIGPKMADTIFRKFGLQTLEIMENNPQELLKIRGISEKKLAAIVESYGKNQVFRELMTFLAPFKVTPKKVNMILKKFGNESVDIIRHRPYMLSAVKGFGFLTVDAIGRQCCCALNDPMRISGCIGHIMNQAMKEGHLFKQRQEVMKEALKMLNRDLQVMAVSEQDVSQVLYRLVLQKSIVVEEERIYSIRQYEEETQTASMIARRLLEKPVLLSIEPELEKAQKTLGITLSETQKQAVRMVFAHPISIITGGPGTGKTTVLKVILYIHQALCRSEVQLMAPTGRAARRMMESTGCENASTMHLALGLLGDDTDFEPDFEYLSAGFLNVDEVSMVDMHLAYEFFRRVSRHARVLLVGDKNQLPSVGAGDVFRQLIACGLIPVTVLDLVYRQGALSSIPYNAKLMQENKTNLSFGEDFQFIACKGADEAAEIVRRIYLDEIAKNGMDQVQILTPYRKRSAAGVDELNKSLEDFVNPPIAGKKELHIGSQVFRVGDKILQNKNTEMASNGDLGRILDCITDEDGNARAVIGFPDGRQVQYEADQMEMIEHANATTIHKAQGSECPVVIIPWVKAFYMMLKRNILYTGVTRAKSKVYLVGEWAAVCQAIHTDDSGTRNTILKADGANMAVMMNIPENYDKVVEGIKAYAKDHSQVNYFDVDNGNLIYEKKELLLERSKTKLLYVASAAGNIIIMLLCGIFVLSIKMECDFPETEWKYRFYIQSGMSSAKVRKGIIKECLLSGGLPVICGTIISILYCSMLLYAKHLQIEWVHRYFKGIILIVGAIWLLFAVFSLIFAYRNIRKIEGDSRDGKK